MHTRAIFGTAIKKEKVQKKRYKRKGTKEKAYKTPMKEGDIHGGTRWPELNNVSPFIVACALSCEVCMQWATTGMTGEEKDCTCAEKTNTKSLEILSPV